MAVPTQTHQQLRIESGRQQQQQQEQLQLDGSVCVCSAVLA